MIPSDEGTLSVHFAGPTETSCLSGRGGRRSPKPDPDSSLDNELESFDLAWSPDVSVTDSVECLRVSFFVLMFLFFIPNFLSYLPFSFFSLTIFCFSHHPSSRVLLAGLSSLPLLRTALLLLCSLSTLERPSRPLIQMLLVSIE